MSYLKKRGKIVIIGGKLAPALSNESMVFAASAVQGSGRYPDILRDHLERALPPSCDACPVAGLRARAQKRKLNEKLEGSERASERGTQSLGRGRRSPPKICHVKSVLNMLCDSEAHCVSVTSCFCSVNLAQWSIVQVVEMRSPGNTILETGNTVHAA